MVQPAKANLAAHKKAQPSQGTWEELVAGLSCALVQRLSLTRLSGAILLDNQ